MNNKIAVIALVVAVIALGGYFAPTSVKEVVKETVTKLGAIPGNEINSECLVVNGVERCYRRQNMQTATTSVCSLPSPTVTSTLLSASARFNVDGYPTTTQVSATFTIYKSTSSVSTSTIAAASYGGRHNPNLGRLAVVYVSGVGGVGQPVSIAATSSFATSSVIAPDSSIIFDLEGAGTPFFGSGVCNAVFEKQ